MQVPGSFARSIIKRLELVLSLPDFVVKEGKEQGPNVGPPL
jgi:hypothetical protein